MILSSEQIWFFFFLIHTRGKYDVCFASMIAPPVRGERQPGSIGNKSIVFPRVTFACGGKVNSSVPKQLVDLFSINPAKFLQVLAGRRVGGMGKSASWRWSPEPLRPDVIRPNSVHFKGFRPLIGIHLALTRNRPVDRNRPRSSKYCLRTVYRSDRDAWEHPDGRLPEDICANIEISSLRIHAAQERSKVHPSSGWRGWFKSPRKIV